MNKLTFFPTLWNGRKKMEIDLTQLNKRRAYTSHRTQVLKSKLTEADNILAGKACVYATGSFGRLEAGENSDLDLFIVGKVDASLPANGRARKSLLTRLDEICVKADLIEETRSLDFPEFDGDGKYLAHYSSDEFVESLGQPDDDSKNTLTGRLLLFLESRPLLGDKVYGEIINDVIAKYWRDYEDHKSNFIPAFLANDILRLWRTFCVNYEARTEREPDDKKIKGKVKNYKLKHSRMLTCYSALLYLLLIHRENGTVSVSDALEMTKLTPTERLEQIVLRTQDQGEKDKINNLLLQYEKFLINTERGDEYLSRRFASAADGALLAKESYEFGDLMFSALHTLGKENRFYRLMVV
ncbi:nucleotidyltransferase domain-containing protein [Nitrospirillum amazonense]|uniref:nucleotidyltransferase domain-containing protein n=1 Tax=Nitrospirillum amazonense TaxID=28077 RepID=UPI002DD43BA0|nr:nucleotidyltransferase domain-containing protein [Nitrospirillum amazonense]MEC4590833.1 nucleotidyltransferase domain-containing protein [Nitrospirillum amazonense]